MTDLPNLAFLLKEEVQSVMYIRDQENGTVLGIDIVTKGHKVTFTTNSTFYIDVENWSDPLPKNTQPD